MGKTLVLTVGGSPQPIVNAIRYAQGVAPRDGTLMVRFLCSCDPDPKRSSCRAVPQIVADLGLEAGEYQSDPIAHYDDLEECYLAARRVLESVPHDERLIANYTGGTKSMTAGLALAALEFEQCEINLVDGMRPGTGPSVKQGTEYTRAVPVRDLRARRQVSAARKRFEDYDYAGAAGLLGAVAQLEISADLRSRVNAAREVCLGYDAWDRFAHERAQEQLASSLEQRLRAGDGEAKQTKLVLGELVKGGGAQDPYLLVEDVLFNAERRAAQSRYDDAAARVYRAIELLAQTRLKRTYRLDSSHLTSEAVEPQLWKRLEEAGVLPRPRADGKRVVGLAGAWALLVAIPDQPLGTWYDPKRTGAAPVVAGGAHGVVEEFLLVRNHSILAHGLTPVTQADYEAKVRPVVERCRQALELLKRDRGHLRAAQLPRQLALLDGL